MGWSEGTKAWPGTKAGLGFGRTKAVLGFVRSESGFGTKARLGFGWTDVGFGLWVQGTKAALGFVLIGGTKARLGFGWTKVGCGLFGQGTKAGLGFVWILGTKIGLGFGGGPCSVVQIRVRSCARVPVEGLGVPVEGLGAMGPCNGWWGWPVRHRA